MTETQKLFTFFEDGEAQAASVRRDVTTNAAPMAYTAAGGVNKLVQGDGSFPFIKDPPESLPVLDYVPLRTIPSVAVVADYFVGPSIDVAGVRTLSLFLEADRTAGFDAPLSVLPQVGYWRKNAITFLPLGVVDTTLTIPGVVDGYASRDVFQTELVWDPGAQQSPPPAALGSYDLVLTFDVAPYRLYRFLFGGRGDQIRLTARITAQR